MARGGWLKKLFWELFFPQDENYLSPQFLVGLPKTQKARLKALVALRKIERLIQPGSERF